MHWLKNFLAVIGQEFSASRRFQQKIRDLINVYRRQFYSRPFTP